VLSYIQYIEEHRGPLGAASLRNMLSNVLLITQLITLAWGLNLKRSTIRTARTCLRSTVADDSKLTAELVSASSESQKLQFDNIFGALARNKHFVSYHSRFSNDESISESKVDDVYNFNYTTS
jgi:hypothetical protein